MARIFGLMILILVGGVAVAAELPIRQGYVYCGDALMATAKGIGGEDFDCEPVAPATESGAVVLICDHSDPSFGPPWIKAARIVEDSIDNTLSYSDFDTYADSSSLSGDFLITLRPCETRF
jgi:hypothetical protein